MPWARPPCTWPSTIIGLARLRRDLLAFGCDLVGRPGDRGVADRQRAAAVGAHAERHAAGVAVNDLDTADRDAQLGRDALRERRLMPLAVAVRAGEHRHRA